MPAIDDATIDQLREQLAQAESDGEQFCAEIARLKTALQASESLKRGYIDEVARLQEAVALYSEGSIRLTAENEKLKKELADALVLLGTEMAK